MSASPMYRDTTAAQLARLDMASVRRRLDIATKMIGEGATVDAIQAATKLATGTAIGGSSLTRLRRQLKRQAAAKPKPVATARPEPAATPDVLALAMRLVEVARSAPKGDAVRAIRAALAYLE